MVMEYCLYELNIMMVSTLTKKIVYTNSPDNSAQVSYR